MAAEESPKPTFFHHFQLVQEDIYNANDEKDYLMVFKCKYLSVLLNLDRQLRINEKFNIVKPPNSGYPK